VTYFKHTIFFCLLTAIISNHLLAQSIITGTLKDEQTKELLAGVSVKYRNGGTTTDPSGRFTITISQGT
jgi:hypothetical protein